MAKVKQDYIVVGAGVAGIASALFLSKRGSSVTLIENSEKIGGLLSSHSRGDFGFFDKGTHILSETGDSEVDNLLFEECYTDKWLQFNSIISSTFFEKKISERQFLDARLMSEDKYKTAFEELINLQEDYGPFKNLDKKIEATFGSVIKKEIFSGVMKKLTGKELSDLSENAHYLFGLGRMVFEDEEISRTLKLNSKWNDYRIAFHDSREGSKNIKHFYPKYGGIGLWADSVQARLERSGVKIITNASIIDIDIESKCIKNIKVSNGDIVTVDNLVWSVPIIFLLRLLKDEKLNQPPPSLCKMILMDVVVDKPLQFKGAYLTCYDKDFHIFRVTNYQVLQNTNEVKRYHKMTVEIIVPPNENNVSNNIDADLILKELKEMRVLEESAQLLKSWLTDIFHGFPQPTPEFSLISKQLVDRSEEIFSNVTFVGRSAGRSFFMNDVILEVKESFY